MGAFGAFGYWAHGLEGRQNELIRLKKEQILKNRERIASPNEGNGGDDEE